MGRVIRERCAGIYVSVDNFGGKIKDVISFVQNIKTKAVNMGYTDIEIEVEHAYDDYTIDIIGSRSETPTERDRRLRKQKHSRKAHEMRKQRIEEKELKELERLNKKYRK